MPVARYYLNDPAAPKPNNPTHIGTNVYLEYDGRLLLERFNAYEQMLRDTASELYESYFGGLLE